MRIKMTEQRLVNSYCNWAEQIFILVMKQREVISTGLILK
jgi:hypothetical protein